MTAGLDRFLGRHGHRGYRELCLRDPSWRDDLSPLVQSMQAAVRARQLTGAREYGLPCVVNAHQATRYFQTGDRVLLDGDAGSVTLLSTTQQRGDLDQPA